MSDWYGTEDASWWYYDNNDDWMSDFDSAFSLDGIDLKGSSDEGSFWKDVWSMVNTPAGMGIIGGVASGIMNQNAADDQLEYLQGIHADDMELAQDELALKEGYLDLANRTLDDKINTRKAHNSSINKIPNQNIKRIT